jgi:hypothetical protein
MRLPDLSTLSLAPPDVADVGGIRNDSQCDPRVARQTWCLLLTPTKAMRQLANTWEVNENVPAAERKFSGNKASSLALSIHFRATEANWFLGTPYKTVRQSPLWHKIIASAVKGNELYETVISWLGPSGKWEKLDPDCTWAGLTSKNLKDVKELATTSKSFLTEFRFEFRLEPESLPLFSYRVLDNMQKYNETCTPPLINRVAKSKQKRARAPAPAPAPEPAPALPSLKELGVDRDVPNPDKWWDFHLNPNPSPSG